MAKILLTGGSGDLGGFVAPNLLSEGHTVVNIDLKPSPVEGVKTIEASITDREAMALAVKGADVLVHIAAWHGIHEPHITPYDFHNLNVTGTLITLEEAAKAGCKKVVLISSTSVSKPYSVYGHTKVLNEEMARAYSHRHGMDVVVLRPRAFIPHWNKNVYKTYAEWAAWYMRGAVHIQDVAQATEKAVAHVLKNKVAPDVPILTIDGAYEYTEEDLESWDAAGLGSTFKKHYGAEAFELLKAKGIDPTVKPKVLNISQTVELLGYQPSYSLKSLIEEVSAQ